MNMPLADRFRPHPNFDDSINSAICQSEIEGGVYVDELPIGAVLSVQTAHTLYRLENREHGQVLISGHDEICPEPVLVNFHGSTWGAAMLKVGFIGRDMSLEFRHPEKGLVRTSRVREIRQLSGPSALPKLQ
jgi:hypothetical protein